MRDLGLIRHIAQRPYTFQMDSSGAGKLWQQLAIAESSAQLHYGITGLGSGGCNETYRPSICDAHAVVTS